MPALEGCVVTIAGVNHSLPPSSPPPLATGVDGVLGLGIKRLAHDDPDIRVAIVARQASSAQLRLDRGGDAFANEGVVGLLNVLEAVCPEAGEVLASSAAAETLTDGSTAIRRDCSAANHQRALELLERRTRVTFPCVLYLRLAHDDQRRRAVVKHVRDDPHVMTRQTTPERSDCGAASRLRIVPQQKRRDEQAGELTSAQTDPGLAGVRVLRGHDLELAIEFLTDHGRVIGPDNATRVAPRHGHEVGPGILESRVGRDVDDNAVVVRHDASPFCPF